MVPFCWFSYTLVVNDGGDTIRAPLSRGIWVMKCTIKGLEAEFFQLFLFNAKFLLE